MIEFNVTHTDDGLKALYLDWWKRMHGVRNNWATGMLALSVFVMLILKSAAWYLVVPTVASACFLALIQTIRYQATKSALDAFTAAGRPALTFQLDESGITETSPMGRVELPWKSFSGLAKINRFWVLYRGPLANAQFIALPEHQLPLEALAFMRERLSALEKSAGK
jgi:hypothetical protein